MASHCLWGQMSASSQGGCLWPFPQPPSQPPPWPCPSSAPLCHLLPRVISCIRNTLCRRICLCLPGISFPWGLSNIKKKKKPPLWCPPRFPQSELALSHFWCPRSTPELVCEPFAWHRKCLRGTLLRKEYGLKRQADLRFNLASAKWGLSS